MGACPVSFVQSILELASTLAGAAVKSRCFGALDSADPKKSVNTVSVQYWQLFYDLLLCACSIAKTVKVDSSTV